MRRDLHRVDPTRLRPVNAVPERLAHAVLVHDDKDTAVPVDDTGGGKFRRRYRKRTHHKKSKKSKKHHKMSKNKIKGQKLIVKNIIKKPIANINSNLSSNLKSNVLLK